MRGRLAFGFPNHWCSRATYWVLKVKNPSLPRSITLSITDRNDIDGQLNTFEKITGQQASEQWFLAAHLGRKPGEYSAEKITQELRKRGIPNSRITPIVVTTDLDLDSRTVIKAFLDTNRDFANVLLVKGTAERTPKSIQEYVSMLNVVYSFGIQPAAVLNIFRQYEEFQQELLEKLKLGIRVFYADAGATHKNIDPRILKMIEDCRRRGYVSINMGIYGASEELFSGKVHGPPLKNVLPAGEKPGTPSATKHYVKEQVQLTEGSNVYIRWVKGNQAAAALLPGRLFQNTALPAVYPSKPAALTCNHATK